VVESIGFIDGGASHFTTLNEFGRLTVSRGVSSNLSARARRPVMLYAYKCPGDASDCQPPTDAQWFLIDAADFYKGDEKFPSDFTGWTQDVFHFAQSVPARIPAGMQNGDYLIREFALMSLDVLVDSEWRYLGHEIIALHVAMGAGAEYYVRFVLYLIELPLHA